MPTKHATVALKPVKSSNVESVGFDPYTKTLAVKFNSGKTYHYHGVPAEVHDGLHKSESIGKFISQHVVRKFDTKLID